MSAQLKLTPSRVILLFEENSLNVSFSALTWCLVLSNTNHRGFHGFNKAPFLNRMPSKLLMKRRAKQKLVWYLKISLTYFWVSPVAGCWWKIIQLLLAGGLSQGPYSTELPCPPLTCSRSPCSGTGCRACWCSSDRQPAWRWRWPRIPEPGWWRSRRHSPAGRRPESGAGGSGWMTSARSWRTTAEEEERREASERVYTRSISKVYKICKLSLF